jgi:hypothetical protein
VKPARVLLVPAAALALYLAVRLATGIAFVDRVSNVIAFAIAAAGCLGATFAFEKGDYLRRGWLFQALEHIVLIVASFLRWSEPPQYIIAARVTCTLVANVFGVAGMVIFARAHVAAGLELPWSKNARRLFHAGMVAAALLAAGPSLIVNLPAARVGDLATWSRMISSVGDVIVFSLIAPLWMTALALRGGLLVWPWGLFTASTFSWLLYDAQDSVHSLVPAISSQSLTIGTIGLRILACTLAFSAGWVQRGITRGTE